MIGIERYRGRSSGEKRPAGVRTFALFAILGAVSGLIGGLAISLSVFGAVALLVALGYYRSADGSPGLTTETTALLVYWLGYLVHDYEILAISTAIVLTILLAAKESIHGFVRDEISETEFFDTLKLLAVVLVVYPLLPDTRLGPYGFLNPRQAWLLVILVSAIGYGGYFLMRWLGPKRGVRLNALAGGIVSTPAATLSLASLARKSPEHAGLYGSATLLANAVQLPRLLLLVAVANTTFGRFLVVPFTSMALAGALAAWLVSRRGEESQDAERLPLRNPLSLTPALKFAAFLVAIMLLVEIARAELGSQGVYLAALLGGAGSVSAVVLSIAEQAGRGGLSLDEAAIALLLALAANAGVKVVLAWMHGTRRLALQLGAGMAAMLLLGALVLTLL